MARDYMELMELMARLKEGIADAFPGKTWVKAEISSWSPRTNGHCYLSLSQTRGGKVVAESRAMIWKWNYPQLKEFFERAAGQPLQAGITVLVRVQVNFSELYGVSLFIDDIDPAFTLGEAALERKRAIEKLTARGYMDMQKELSLPRLPYRLAVITSKTAAGYGDFRRHLLENEAGYAFQVDLYEALMQGESAPASIMAAILEIGEKPYDALLILRGGGSELDLACFDDFDLAVTIATCPVPVFTAIGHDRDYHIADMVANRSVKTPTALADLFLDCYAAEDALIDAAENRIARDVRRRLSDEGMRLKVLDARTAQGVGDRLNVMGGRLDAAHNRIRLALARKENDLVQSLQQRSARISMGLMGMVNRKTLALEEARTRVSRGLTRKQHEVAKAVDVAASRLKYAAGARLGMAVSAVALKEALVKASDPRKILALGYVLVTGQDNKVLKTVDRVAVGDCIGVRFADGSLRATVGEVYTEHVDNDKVNIA